MIGIRSVLRKCKYFWMDFIYTEKDAIRAFWFRNDYNFGDALNPIFLHLLTGRKVFWVNQSFYTKQHYLVVGSILESARKTSIIWGPGFISENGKCMEEPTKICAVRGPNTRRKLLEQGYDCPEVYGDPALLLPYVYPVKCTKKYKLGIIPHYLDKDSDWLKSVMNNSEIKILDVQRSDPLKFIDEIVSCEKIASSSLHGIIVADAYCVPSVWLEFSDKLMGNGFKFLDYFLSVNRKDKRPLVINESISVEDILDFFYDYKIEIDLEKLIESCPFEIEIDIKYRLDQKVNSQ